MFGVQEAPSTILRRLATLEAMEHDQPEKARWFQLVEFAGVTAQELARYIKQPLEVVEVPRR